MQELLTGYVLFRVLEEVIKTVWRNFKPNGQEEV
jgi:hypothetical protein